MKPRAKERIVAYCILGFACAMITLAIGSDRPLAESIERQLREK